MVTGQWSLVRMVTGPNPNRNPNSTDFSNYLSNLGWGS